MATFQEVYCQRHRCRPEAFERRVFWRCLYHHARFFAPLFFLNTSYFSPDRALIHSVAEAVTMQRVRDDVRDYFWDSNNRGWIREKLLIRVSGQRVKNLAREYLPEGATPLPFPPSASAADSARSR